jgi:hypothetical protein
MANEFEDLKGETHHNVDIDIADRAANVYDTDSHTLLRELTIEEVSFNGQIVNGQFEVMGASHVTYFREEQILKIHV